jgi:hypothetical protein
LAGGSGTVDAACSVRSTARVSSPSGYPGGSGTAWSCRARSAAWAARVAMLDATASGVSSRSAGNIVCAVLVAGRGGPDGHGRTRSVLPELG